VRASSEANNGYFLPQAFPEGSPTHPAYPTGHGTVAVALSHLRDHAHPALPGLFAH
jgi:hypothetical protein